MHIINRPRRLRKNSGIRAMISENSLKVEDLIMPLFFCEGKQIKDPIKSMPGQFRYSIDELVKKTKELSQLGVRCVAIFPVINEELKSSRASEAINPNGLNQVAIDAIKQACPDLMIMTDIALDPYSSDGHDGIVDAKTGKILNDETLEILSQMALVQAEAGADIIGPSDMMDHRVGVIRKTLEAHSYSDIIIMSYSAKYASHFYGPFRDALDSAPKAGDKKTYQMDFRNGDEALKEAQLDIQEGADILMVKPGLSYLDVIYRLKQSFNVPIAAYNVSGEYAMVKAAHKNGWLDGEQVMVEALTSFKRAGADIILSYFTEEMATLLKKI